MDQDRTLGLGKGLEIAAVEVDVARLEGGGPVVVHQIAAEGRLAEVGLAHIAPPGIVLGVAEVVLDHHPVKAWRPAGGVAPPLIGAPEIDDHRQTQPGHGVEIRVGGPAVVGGAVEPSPVDHGPASGGVAAIVAKIEDAFERQDTIGHGLGVSAGLLQNPAPSPQPDPYSAGRAFSVRLDIMRSNSDHTPSGPSQRPRVAALEYSVERASKKLACSTPLSNTCSQGSGFSLTP